MPARHSNACRHLVVLAACFAGLMVGTLVAALVTQGVRPLILWTTISIISAAASALCTLGWMFRKWVMPLSVAWNVATREAERQAAGRPHLSAVGD